MVRTHKKIHSLLHHDKPCLHPASIDPDVGATTMGRISPQTGSPARPLARSSVVVVRPPVRSFVLPFWMEFFLLPSSTLLSAHLLGRTDGRMEGASSARLPPQRSHLARSLSLPMVRSSLLTQRFRGTFGMRRFTFRMYFLHEIICSVHTTSFLLKTTTQIPSCIRRERWYGGEETRKFAERRADADGRRPPTMQAAGRRE